MFYHVRTATTPAEVKDKSVLEVLKPTAKNFKPEVYRKMENESARYKEEEQKPRTYGTQFTTVIYSITVMVVLCLNILVTFITHSEKSQYLIRLTEPIEYLSEYCSSLSMHPEDDIYLFDTVRSGLKISVNSDRKYVCKTTNETQIVDTVVEKYDRVQLASGLRPHRYLSCGNKRLALKSGDMSLYFSHVSKQFNHLDIDSQEKLLWDTDTAHSNVHLGVLYHDGEVTILEGRIYYVFASINFRINNITSKMTNGNIRLSVAILRKTIAGEVILLEETKFYRKNNEHFSNSLRVASFIPLQKRDVLFVRVSDSRLLHYDSKGNVFGLFPA